MVCCCSLAGTRACLSCNNYANNITSIPYNHEKIIVPTIPNLIEQKEKIKPIKEYYCSNCESLLTIYQKYCHNCGKEIDWNNYK